MGLASAGPTDQHSIALLGDEAASGKIVDERLVDRRALELEVTKVLGEWQLGDGELVLDRACLLLADLGVEQIADDLLSLMLARIASPGMLPDGRSLPHLICSPSGSVDGGEDEAGQHGDAR